jgi:PAS domain S-box-containing protein
MLEIQARQREARISGALRSVHLMAGSIVDDVQQEPAMPVADRQQSLKNYLRQLPEIRSLLITDADGRVQVHTQQAAIGFQAVDREYFKTHRDAPENDHFHISLPFKTVTGIVATTQSRVMRDSQGRFAGVVVATIDATFFNEMLQLSESEQGFQILLINRNGDILNIMPQSELTGKNLQGGIAYTEHIRSGRPTTRHLNQVKLEPLTRMSVFHDVPNAPLTVIVARDYSYVIAEWRYTMYSHLLGFLLLFSTIILVSWLAVRRQNALVQAQRQVADRESLLRAVIESQPECVKQLAVDGSVLHMNRAGLNMIEADSLDQVLGQSVQQMVTPEYREAFMGLTQKVFSGESGELIFELQGLKGSRRWLETHATPLRDAESQIIALLGITRDITERKSIEDALEAERRQLQKALEEVKTLRGIVPICSNCKKIRDDKGFWSQVEKYVSDHTEAEFSHGICPDCTIELYPELIAKSDKLQEYIKKT